MSAQSFAPVKATPSPSCMAARTGLVQRKCACGTTAGGCEECQGKKRLGPRLQAKLRINEPGDVYEQEADRVADQVLATPAHRVASVLAPRLQRFTGQATESANAAPASVDRVLASSGRPLEPALRQDMEQRFGHDFSHVRVHSDAAAERSAREVNAHAYTVGVDVVFGAGCFAPGTQEGRRLIAHELAHVVQQGGAVASESAHLQENPPADRFEQEAERVGNAVMIRPKEVSLRRVATGGLSHFSRNPCSLQRSATFVQGTLSEDINPAEQIAENKIPNGLLFLGDTKFVLNKTAFIGGIGVPAARKALRTPGIESEKRMEGGVWCGFSSVPDNVGSYDMRVLKQGSWTHVTDNKNVAGRFPTLKACKNGFGEVTFVVRANNDLRKKVETHEKHHADDYKAIFNGVLVPWDGKVNDVQKKGKHSMAGTSDGDCEKKLYSSVGKKQAPDDIVSSIINDIETRAKAFHDSPAGSKPTLSIQDVDSDCNVVKANVR